MTTFTPGDVALVMGPDEKWRLSLRAITNDGWWDDEGAHDADSEVSRVRPIVVIDPEDRQQVERLREAASRWSDRVPYSDMREDGDLTHLDAMQNAVRELVAPPKPPEPTGLGAVVEDDRGKTWVRNHRGSWQRKGVSTVWHNFNAVRVLSEGVQP